MDRRVSPSGSGNWSSAPSRVSLSECRGGLDGPLTWLSSARTRVPSSLCRTGTSEDLDAASRAALCPLKHRRRTVPSADDFPLSPPLVTCDTDTKQSIDWGTFRCGRPRLRSQTSGTQHSPSSRYRHLPIRKCKGNAPMTRRRMPVLQRSLLSTSTRVVRQHPSLRRRQRMTPDGLRPLQASGPLAAFARPEVTFRWFPRRGLS